MPTIFVSPNGVFGVVQVTASVLVVTMPCSPYRTYFYRQKINHYITSFDPGFTLTNLAAKSPFPFIVNPFVPAV